MGFHLVKWLLLMKMFIIFKYLRIQYDLRNEYYTASAYIYVLHKNENKWNKQK